MNARAARRGFTALELMMATAIGAVVLLAALGVFGMMERMDRFHAQRFRESSDLVFAHTVLERAMQTLVAKAEVDPQRIVERSTGVNQDDAALEEGEDGVDPRDRKPDDGLNDLRRRQAEGLRRAEERRTGVASSRTVDEFGREIAERPMFVLEPAGVLTAESIAPRRMEVTMLAQPAPGAPRTPLFVRGAFEAAPRGNGWALVYVPLVPAGEPIPLLEGIRDMRWELLVRGESSAGGMLRSRDEEDLDKGGVRVEELNANVARQFPKAIRFIALLSTGQTVDWMFEPSVTTAGVYDRESSQ